MIVTVTLNAAVDRTYRVEGFAPDRVYRPAETRVAAGGKGINVARVLHKLGGQVLATGFVGGNCGRFIERALQQEGLQAVFEHIRHESRMCVTVVDPSNRTLTEINEVGPVVSRGEVGRFVDLYVHTLQQDGVQFVALSGSVPPGAPCGVYARLIEVAREREVRCLLDTSGPALSAGIAARPWMVKPNLEELAELLGHDVVGEAGALDGARRMLDKGIEVVAVTMGAAGAVCVSGDEAWRAVPPEVRSVSPEGSGDAFVAGFLLAWSTGKCLPECLQLATAAGAANAEVYGAGFCSAAQIRDAAPRVVVYGLA